MCWPKSVDGAIPESRSSNWNSKQSKEKELRQPEPVDLTAVSKTHADSQTRKKHTRAQNGQLPPKFLDASIRDHRNLHENQELQ